MRIVVTGGSGPLGSEVVRIELSEPLAAVPTGFTVQTPPRVAIDLPGVTNGIGRSTVEINQGILRSVNLAQTGDRTRLVLNLRQPAAYRAQIQGKVLLLVIESSAAPVASTSPTGEPVHFAESLNRSTVSLRDIDFRRGPDGAGRVVVDLPNNQVDNWAVNFVNVGSQPVTVTDAYVVAGCATVP